MRSLKLAGAVACGLALSVTTAAAAPQLLDDAALDGVVAGVEFPGGSSFSGFGTERPTFGQGFPTFVPVVVPEITIEVERAVPVVTETNEGTTSTSITTGGPAKEFLANPPTTPFFPRFTFRSR